MKKQKSTYNQDTLEEQQILGISQISRFLPKLKQLKQHGIVQK